MLSNALLLVTAAILVVLAPELLTDVHQDLPQFAHDTFSGNGHGLPTGLVDTFYLPFSLDDEPVIYALHAAVVTNPDVIGILGMRN